MINIYRQFKVELIRDGKVADSALVWEYDDDCVSANVFYQALDAFNVKNGDIVKTVCGSTLIRLEDDEFHYINL